MARFTSLMYHNLAASPASAYDVRPAVFEEQLDWLLGEGFVVEDFDGLAKRVLSSDGAAATARDLPARYVVLSFDDGHESCLEAAAILEARGLRATFFCCRDVSERDEFLDESGIRELASAMSIGSHGVTHRALTKMPFEEARRELSDNRQWLEDLLGLEVRWFSPPFGEIDGRLHQACLEEGHQLIGDSMEWSNHPGGVATSRLVHRIMISGAGSVAEQQQRFRAAASCSRRLLMPRRARYELARVVKRVLSEEQILRLARLKRKVFS